MIQYVATEYGVVCLSGLSLGERAPGHDLHRPSGLPGELERYAREEMEALLNLKQAGDPTGDLPLFC